jgi:hypothetical protein
MEKMLKPANGSAAPTKEIFSLLTLELWHREFMDYQDIQLERVAQFSE